MSSPRRECRGINPSFRGARADGRVGWAKGRAQCTGSSGRTTQRRAHRVDIVEAVGMARKCAPLPTLTAHRNAYRSTITLAPTFTRL
jgi:hypothetical protein